MFLFPYLAAKLSRRTTKG